MNIQIGQVFTQILAFLVMYWVMKRYAWKPILKLLEERRSKIQSEFDAIEQQKGKIDDLVHEYKAKLKQIDVEAHKKLQAAIEEGRAAQSKIQSEAHAQAKEILMKAEADVKREMELAKDILKKDVVKIAMQATEKILESQLTPENKEKIFNDFAGKGLMR
jgi:F-type H+-transporting ATPase subunit b